MAPTLEKTFFLMLRVLELPNLRYAKVWGNTTTVAPSYCNTLKLQLFSIFIIDAFRNI